MFRDKCPWGMCPGVCVKELSVQGDTFPGNSHPVPVLCMRYACCSIKISILPNIFIILKNKLPKLMHFKPQNQKNICYDYSVYMDTAVLPFSPTITENVYFWVSCSLIS